MLSNAALSGLALDPSGNHDDHVPRLMVVEDDAIVASDLSSKLAALGYEIVGLAGTAEAALQLASDAKPDIAIMDIRLSSERDGINVAQELRDRFNIFSIFATAYSDNHTLGRAEKVKPLGYLVKPFRDREVKATLSMAAAQLRLIRASNRAQAWLSAVLTSMSDGVIALDDKNRITFVNPATEALLGARSADLLRQDVNTVFERIGLGNLLPAPLRTNVHMALKVRDGGERTLELAAAPVNTAESTPPGSVLVVRDITDRTIAARLIQRERDLLAGRVSSTGAELERTRGELLALTASLLTAQEDERRRIAREIHDDLAQRAAALEIRAVAIGDTLGTGHPAALAQVRELKDCIRELSDSMRVLSHHLHPAILDDLGLEIALRRYSEEYGRRRNISIIFRATRVPRSLDRTLALGIYRIAQEALSNVAKHSGSAVAAISLSRVGNQIRMTVRDWGSGFDPATVRYAGGLGLISMQERSRIVSGKIAVISRRGAGTLVTLRVPFRENEG